MHYQKDISTWQAYRYFLGYFACCPSEPAWRHCQQNSCMFDCNSGCTEGKIALIFTLQGLLLHFLKSHFMIEQKNAVVLLLWEAEFRNGKVTRLKQLFSCIFRTESIQIKNQVLNSSNTSFLCQDDWSPKDFVFGIV